MVSSGSVSCQINVGSEELNLFLIIMKVVLSGASTKTHMYWCMKNCDGNAAKLQENILNIVQHYSVSIVR